MKSKKFKFICAALAACSLVCGVCACSDGEESIVKKSELFGTFTYQQTLGLGGSKLTITSDRNKTGERAYLYSTVFPLESVSDMSVAYNMDQRLKLNRDYTYKYDYTVTLTNPGDWGAQFARLVVSVTGEFDYRDSGDGMYSVLLGDPTGGTKSIYASQLSGTWIYNWSMHSRPDLVIDYAAAPLMDDFTYDKHVAEHIVRVDRNSKTLGEDIFDAELLNEITLYSSY